MKADEVKLRISNFLNNMIDTYYGNPVATERILNYTLKIIVNNNIGKIGSLLTLFEDSNGEINAQEILKEYANRMGNDKLVFNLKNYIDIPFVKAMLPDKSLVISSDDISRIMGNDIQQLC